MTPVINGQHASHWKFYFKITRLQLTSLQKNDEKTKMTRVQMTNDFFLGLNRSTLYSTFEQVIYIHDCCLNFWTKKHLCHGWTLPHCVTLWGPHSPVSMRFGCSSRQFLFHSFHYISAITKETNEAVLWRILCCLSCFIEKDISRSWA